MPANRKLGCIDLPEVTPPSTPQRWVSRSRAQSPYRSNSIANAGGPGNTPSRSNSTDYHPQLPSNLLLNLSSMKITPICLNDDESESPPPSAISLSSETTSNNGDKPVSPTTPDDRNGNITKSDHHLTRSPGTMTGVFATPNTMRIQSCPWGKESDGNYSSSATAEGDDNFDDDAWWEMNQPFEAVKPSDFVRKD